MADSLSARLRELAEHIERMDSGSGDAALLRQSANELDDLRACLDAVKRWIAAAPLLLTRSDE